MADHPGTQVVSTVDHSRKDSSCCPARDAWAAGVWSALPGPIAAALPQVPALTARERAAFHLLGVGCDNHTIARRLSISERTAKRHVTAILVKLGLESRLQAGLAAMAVALVATGRACEHVVSG